MRPFRKSLVCIIYSTLTVFLVILPQIGNTQRTTEVIHPVAKEVLELFAEADIETYTLFEPDDREDLAGVMRNAVAHAEYFRIDQSMVYLLTQKKPPLVALRIEHPGNSLVLDMFRVELFSPAYRLRTDEGVYYESRDASLFYRGIIRGDSRSIVCVSIIGGEARLLYSTEGKNMRMHHVDEDTYVLYHDQDILHKIPFSCEAITVDDPDAKDSSIHMRAVNSGNCVEIYFECDYKAYQDNGNSVAQTESWVAMLFNEVATIYAIENIPVGISDIMVWTTTDPYASIESINQILIAFRNHSNQNGYDGRLGHLLSTRNVGGGIAYVNVLCSSSSPYGVSASLSTNITQFPDYSWNVMVVTHELGHNFGSQHTHACVWNGNNTQIDDCGPVAGYGTSCYDQNNPILPDAGTIMSYCHLLGDVGIDFTLAFGPLPGALIYDKFSNASCNTGICPPPDCIVLLHPENGAEDVEVNPTIAWQVSPGALGYLLTLGTTPGGADILSQEDVGNVVSFNPGSLPEQTDIFVRIEPYNALGFATNCTEESFTTGSHTEYCNASSSSVQYEWISTVSFAGFNNNSGAQTYSDFTHLTTDLQIGSTYGISITPGFSGQSYPEYYRVWIDYNKNGEFDPATELVFTAGPSSNMVSGSFTIPVDATPGNTRLRAAMRYNGWPPSCGSFQYGEVEDYTVRLRCNVVTNTQSTGPGSLLWAVECSSAGDTIFFAEQVHGDTIFLNNQPIVIPHDLFISNTLANQVWLHGNTAGRVFEITNEATVRIEGLYLRPGFSTTGGIISNEGTLTLQDIIIYADPGLPNALLILNNGSIQVQGILEIHE